MIKMTKKYDETEVKAYYYDENGRVSYETTSVPRKGTFLKDVGLMCLIGAAGAAGYAANMFLSNKKSKSSEENTDGGEE